MLCNKCGKEFSDEAKFCPQCGASAEMDEVNETESLQQEETKSFSEAMQEQEATFASAAEAETEQGGVVTEEKPEQPENQPEEQTAEQVSEPVSEKALFDQPVKNSKKGIIIGASAAVAVAGAAAVGYFCFSNEIMHLFMGDAGFAQMLEGKSMEYMFGGEVETEQIDIVLADYIEQMAYGTDEAATTDTNAIADQIFSAYGDTSVSMTAELDPGMLLSLADSEGVLSNMKLEALVEAVQGDDCDRISYILTENGERVLGADAYLQGENIALLMPELTDETFTASTAIEEDEAAEVKEKVEFDEAEMKRIRESLTDIYNDAVAKSAIEYTKSGTDLVLAGCAVDSERVIITVSAENVDAMLQEMSDFLKNDEYLRNYYVQATGEDVSEYENKFSEEENSSSTQIIIENYYTDHAEVTGKKIILSETDTETGETFDISFEATLGNCDFHIGDEELSLDFTQRKTEEGCGKMELTINPDSEVNTPFVLDIEYSGVDTAEYCGQPVNTGKYTISVSEKDKFLDSVFEGTASTEDGYDSDMMEDALPDSGMDLSSMASVLKDIVIEVNTECDGSSISSSFTMDVPLLFTIIFTTDLKPLEAEKPVMPDCTDATRLDEDFDLSEHEELQTEITESLISLADKSTLIGMIMEYAGI